MKWMILPAGAALFAYGGFALAQSGPQVSVSYEVLFQVTFGGCLLLIGGYAKGLGGRMRSMEAAIEALRTQQSATQLSIATDHHTKTEANQHHAELKSEILALHRRFDYMHIPASFPKGDSP